MLTLKKDNVCLALPAQWALQGLLPGSPSDRLLLCLSLGYFAHVHGISQLYQGVSTEDRMQLSNSKPWGWDGYHLLEVKGT